MHKVVPVFALLGFAVALTSGYFATIPTAAASTTSAAVQSDPAPPDLDVPGALRAPNVVVPAKRKATTATTTTKHRVYQCEIRPLLMGTVDTTARVCDWRDG